MINTLNMFIKMQYHMSSDVLKILFPEDWYHYYVKWKDSNDNFLIFINNLDDINKEKVLNWGLTI